MFRLKTNADGFTRYKSLLVIRGFEQLPGIDFHQTFALVGKFVTLRVLLALAAHYDWQVEQIDVKTAFLHEVLKEEVFMTVPEGYSEYSNMPGPTIAVPMLRLLKALYSLKQAPRAWYDDVNRFFMGVGMTQLREDHSLYFSNDLVILLYVDDLLLFAKDMQTIDMRKKNLHQQKLSFAFSASGASWCILNISLHPERQFASRTSVCILRSTKVF